MELGASVEHVSPYLRDNVSFPAGEKMAVVLIDANHRAFSLKMARFLFSRYLRSQFQLAAELGLIVN